MCAELICICTTLLIFLYQGGDEAHAALALSRTSTGILSNRRPGAAPSTETSGTTTPVESRPRYNLLVTAKREAAKQNLYSRFFRGPVLGPDTSLDQGKQECSPDDLPEHVPAESPQPDAEVESQKAKKRVEDAEKSEGQKKKKKKRGETEERTRRKDEKSKSCREAKRKRRANVEDIPNTQNDSDEEHRLRTKKRDRAAGRKDSGGNEKRRRKNEDVDSSPKSNIPPQDIPESEDPVHRKKRRRKE